MTMISIITMAARDAWPALFAGLETEYGHDGAVEIATQFIAAEAADFHWVSRMMERHLGRYEALDDDGEELDQVAIIGQLRATWFVAICVVDGDGAVHSMHGLRLFTSAWDADEAFQQLR